MADEKALASPSDGGGEAAAGWGGGGGGVGCGDEPAPGLASPCRVTRSKRSQKVSTEVC